MRPHDSKLCYGVYDDERPDPRPKPPPPPPPPTEDGVALATPTLAPPPPPAPKSATTELLEENLALHAEVRQLRQAIVDLSLQTANKQVVIEYWERKAGLL